MDAVPKRIAIENEEGREEDKGSDEDTSDGHKQKKSNFTTGDYVKITKNSYKDYYATVTGCSYHQEIEINYFEKRKNIGKLSWL